VERIDPEYLRKHYAGLSDEALMAVDRGELVDLAQAVYDGEVQHRGLPKDKVLPEVSAVQTEPPRPRLRTVKRAALLACVATALALAIPMWDSSLKILALEPNIGKLGALVAILLGYSFASIVPLFYFAVYLNEGELLVSRNLRWTAIAAAAVIGVLGAAAIPGWIGSFQRETVLDSAARSWTPSDTSMVLGQISNVAGILLLAALSRLPGNAISDRRVAGSKLLRLLTTIAIIAGGIVMVGCAIGIAATPWVYSYIHERYSNVDWTFPGFAVDRIRAALSVLCTYAAPFVVWKGRKLPARNCNSV
jgi:hypothetical protein